MYTDLKCKGPFNFTNGTQLCSHYPKQYTCLPPEIPTWTFLVITVMLTMILSFINRD